MLVEINFDIMQEKPFGTINPIKRRHYMHLHKK